MIETVEKVTKAILPLPLALPVPVTTVVTALQIGMVAYTVAKTLWDLVGGDDSP